MTKQATEILVIGGGPGGYTAAIRAAQLGYEVSLAERAELGGVCLNWGCIPTKSLLHTADLLREIESAASLGLEVAKPKFNLAKVIERSRQVAAQLSAGVSHLMRKNAITLLEGEASFQDSQTLRVADQLVSADKVIIATGARAKSLPHIQVDGNKIWDARTAMTPPFLPKRLLIIGAGAIGVEFASFYASLGVEVTLIEALAQLLPAEDAEIAGLAAQALKNAGMDIRTSTTVDSLEPGGQGLAAVIAGQKEKYDAAIVSVGVTGNIEGLGLEQLGVQCEQGFILAGAQQETNIPGIYAIGDVAGAPCLAHKASHEGIVAVETIAGLAPKPLNRQRIPGCTYSHPQVASIGLTEQQAQAKGEVRVGRFPLIANGKAVAINDTDGLVKTIFNAKTGELLGAHLIGPGVTEMIQGFALALGLETTEQELMETIFPHPTLSEAMHESVLAAYGRTINL